MNNIVIDTDIFVDYFRRYEKSEKFFEGLRSKDNIIYFSAITETELVSGKECNISDVKSKLLNFLSNFAKVSIDNQIAIKAGDFKRIYDIKTPDAIIAATASVMRATLITRNIKDYKKIDAIKLNVPY